MQKQLGEVYYRNDVPLCEKTMSFTGLETEEDLRILLRDSEGVYHAMLIFTELRKKGATP